MAPISSSGREFPMSSSFPAPAPPLTPPYEDLRLLEEVYTKTARRAFILISLDAVKHNIRILKSLAGSKTELMAVVKGSAYGSGIMPVVAAALEAGATELAVATVGEGVHLRTNSVTVPITVLGNLNSEELPDVLSHRLHPTVSGSSCIDAAHVSKLKYADGTPLELNVEVDTGMSRYGVSLKDLECVMAALLQQGVRVRSLYSHYQASISTPDLNKQQLQLFLQATKLYPDIPRHIAATTGCVQGLGADMDYIRPGGAITGLCSGSSIEDVEAFAKCGFQPAFSVVARPSYFKLLPAGRHVGYDATYTTQQDEWIANFSTGWSDGLPRKLTNIGYVKRLKTGQLCPIVGRVSMDSITVRLPEAPDASESFVIITSDYHPLTSAVGISRQLGAAVYEIPGNWSTRLPRVAVEDGRVKQVLGSLEYTN